MDRFEMFRLFCKAVDEGRYVDAMRELVDLADYVIAAMEDAESEV